MKKFNSIKIIIAGIVVVFGFYCQVQANMPDEAQAYFAKGDYMAGMNTLTKAINATDPAERAQALLAYGRFYESLVGNVDYAMNFYNDILRTNLPENDPIKTAALKDISRIKLLKIQYSAEDSLLKRLRPAESANESQKAEQIQQLLSIVQHKPDYYRLSEVYYQLGRNYFATDNLYVAYKSLNKSLALRPAVNFYLPVTVWIEASHYRLVQFCTHAISWGILGGLLIITALAFYVSRPWRWLRFRHFLVGLSMLLLWIAVFAISYIFLVAKQNIYEPVLLNANAAPPYFLSFGPDSPFWGITKSLFYYGLVCTAGLFVFSIGTSRIKHRWAAMLINVVFALLLFSSLATVFYMRNCDQKSLFASPGTDGIPYYAKGGNYFTAFGMEPYILTNPKAYPNLAMSNVSDTHMRDWILKNCPFTGPENNH